MEYLNHVPVLAGLAVLVIHQILKLKFIPLTFANRYPVPTLIILSILASMVAVWQNQISSPHGWTDWIQLVATITVVAAVTYNMTIKNWADLRAMEG